MHAHIYTHCNYIYSVYLKDICIYIYTWYVYIYISYSMYGYMMDLRYIRSGCIRDAVYIHIVFFVV